MPARLNESVVRAGVISRKSKEIKALLKGISEKPACRQVKRDKNKLMENNSKNKNIFQALRI